MGGRRVKCGEELGICHDMPVILRKPRWFPHRTPSANETPTFASIELEVLRICAGNRWEIAVLYHLWKNEESAKNDKLPRNMCCTPTKSCFKPSLHTTGTIHHTVSPWPAVLAHHQVLIQRSPKLFAHQHLLIRQGVLQHDRSCG